MIYLVRHGETEFNREQRIQGRSESVLTELGREQSHAYAALLARLIGDAEGWRLVSSPLVRARATAEAIGERLGLAVEIEPLLTEVGCGEWKGQLLPDLMAADPPTFADRFWFFRGPGGDTYDDVLGRVSAWLAAQSPEPDRRVIAVSHGVAGRILRGVYAGMDPITTMNQDVPQDAIFRLARGAVERLACD
ncbi:MAG TPA: histidine phosphatase family protein [Phenylobacterium sp.]